MNKKTARRIRAGLVFAELVIQNPLVAEWAPSILTPLGYRAYVHAMDRYGFVRPGANLYI